MDFSFYLENVNNFDIKIKDRFLGLNRQQEKTFKASLPLL